MGKSFIVFKDKGFWSHDSTLCVLLYLNVRRLNNGKDRDDWTQSVVKDWTFYYSAGFVGCIPIDLDKKLPDENYKRVIVDSLRTISKNLHQDSNYFPVEELHLNLVGGKGVTWLEVTNDFRNELIRISHMLIDLIEGRLDIDVSSKIDYLREKSISNSATDAQQCICVKRG